MDVSLIVPVLNEQENVRLLYEEITAALKTVQRPYELLFIDDGSRDATWARLEENPFVKLVDDAIQAHANLEVSLPPGPHVVEVQMGNGEPRVVP